MEKQKIVIIGDSLAAERPDGFLDSERWPQLLNERLAHRHTVINLSKGFSSTNELNVKFNDKLIKMAQIVVIQLGIVDCVPRYFTSREHKLISKVPHVFRTHLIRVLKSLRSQSPRRAYVSRTKFRQNLESFFGRKSGSIYYVKILSPGKKFESRNPLAYQSINAYNTVLDELATVYTNVKIIEVDSSKVDELTLEDGYHFNKKGHLYLAELIAESIDVANDR